MPVYRTAMSNIGQMLASDEERAAAEQIRVTFPVFADGGSHLNVSGVAMTKSAPNKAEALKFMEWLSSDAAQAIYAEKNYEFPVNPAVARSALVQSWGEFTVDSVSLSDVAAARPAALKIMEEIDFDN